MTHLVVALVTLAISGRTNATPSVSAANQFVAVAWGATLPWRGTDVYAAVSRDGGRTFSQPVRVNDVEGSASLSLEQPPRVSLVTRIGKDPSIVVVWTAKSKQGTRVLVSRSEDGGVSFTPSAVVGGSDAPGNRGWVSTAVDRSGHVIVVWLDHREMASGHDHSSHAPKSDGAVRAQASKLYFATVDAPSSAQPLAGGVCYCCKTAVTAGPDGTIYAAWRHVYPGNIRDIGFVSSRDNGRTFSTPVRVSDDRWMIEGCPENGPALAAGPDNAVHVLWPTLVPATDPNSEPSLALFHATTTDGRTFSKRERVTTEGTPRHPQLLSSPRGLAAAWDEELDGGARRVVFTKAVTHEPEVLSTGRAQTPALAPTDDG
ncbi:MAG TPA: sialidase family protein, partial [Vicinamibacterales bacterium]|nr:sialidase family protein [Vicinamibacterales bacterium]